jgi:hypothetical protein
VPRSNSSLVFAKELKAKCRFNSAATVSAAGAYFSNLCYYPLLQDTTMTVFATILSRNSVTIDGVSIRE